MSASRLLEVLDAALRSHAGQEIELSAVQARQGTTRFANSRVTQTGEVEELVVQARVALGRRVGVARASSLAPEALAELIRRARVLAAALPEGAFSGFDEGGRPSPICALSYDEATARSGAGERAQLVEPTLDAAAADRASAAGLAATTVGTLAVATSAGARRLHHYTRARLDAIVTHGEASGRASQVHVALGALEAPRLAEEARARASRARAPTDLPPGSYDVILEPPAVAELLEWLALTGLGARTLEDGSSCLAGRLGEPITGESVTIYDDPLAGEDGCPTLPFDAEGTAKARLVLIERGTARAYALDRDSAAHGGRTSTGHAPPLADELLESGPVPQHLHMAAGAAEASQLLDGVERGLWVSRFHYVNGLCDTRRALMTGMTRDGLFLIEKGRIVGAVRNLRWTESMLEAFTRIDGATRARQVVAGSLGDAVYVCPTLRVRGWRFTGASQPLPG